MSGPKRARLPYRPLSETERQMLVDLAGGPLLDAVGHARPVVWHDNDGNAEIQAFVDKAPRRPKP